MSQKIDDVLLVLEAIHKAFRIDRPGSVRQSRVGAVRSIAARRGVTYQTIGDAYLRRLDPDLKGTAAFDRLTEDWLVRKSQNLERILEKQALDSGDESRIHAFFLSHGTHSGA